MNPLPPTTRALLDDIRTRLQQAHFSARGIELRLGAEPQAVADQLHCIRLLAERLDAVLAA